MTNTKIAVVDISRVNDVYGPSDNMIKGKEAQSKSHSHQQVLRIPVPHKILSAYKSLKLYIDIIYVCKMMFLITIFENIDLRSIPVLTSGSLYTITNGIQVVIDKHCGQGFHITYFHEDPELMNKNSMTSLSQVRYIYVLVMSILDQ